MASEGFRLASSCINKEGRLPIKFTGEGQVVDKDISPPLEWYNGPQGTKSLALVVEDLDGGEPSRPKVPCVHWLVLNIPPTLKGLPQGFSGKQEQMGGNYATVKEGIYWRGPDMVSHGHRFQFKIYALDNDNMQIGHQVTKEKLLEKIQGHILGDAVMTSISELSPQGEKDKGSPFTSLLIN